MEEFSTYFRVEFIDLFNGGLNVAGVDCIPDFHPFLNGPKIVGRLEVCLDSKLSSRHWISFVDKVIHYHKVDVPVYGND